MTRGSCHASRHQRTSLDTPSRSCLTSPPSTPPMRRRLGLSLVQATGKWSSTAAEWCHPMLPSQVPRRVPRVAKRGESGTLNELPCVPHQAQAQEMWHDKKIHDLRGSHQGQGARRRPRQKGRDTLPHGGRGHGDVLPPPPPRRRISNLSHGTRYTVVRDTNRATSS
jgi:hypothetical protein